MPFQNKTIVLTGGTRGIGLELCKLLALNNSVIVVSSNETNLAELKHSYPNLRTIVCDLSIRKDIERCIDQLDDLSHIDLLINNAAVQYYPEFLNDDFEFEGIRKEISINFTSVCELTYLLLPKLLASNKGANILNMSSGLALAPKKSSAIYCATKAAISSFTRSLRYQLKSYRIKVHQAFPPLTKTQMTGMRSNQDSLEAPSRVASEILAALERGTEDIYIGKIKVLRVLLWLLPSVARKLMSQS